MNEIGGLCCDMSLARSSTAAPSTSKLLLASSVGRDSGSPQRQRWAVGVRGTGTRTGADVEDALLDTLRQQIDQLGR